MSGRCFSHKEEERKRRMAGISLFLPNEQMDQQGQEIFGQMGDHHVGLLKTINTEKAGHEARGEVSQGANIIGARGSEGGGMQRDNHGAG